MMFRPWILMVFLSAAARAGNYSLEPVTIDSGGGSGASANYGLTASTTPGGYGDSRSYTASTGFAGQLGGPVGISISASSRTLAENANCQLAAELLYDDGSRAPLSPTAITWSVADGPIAEISATGFATATAVYQDTPVTVRGARGSFSAEQTLTVIDTLRDNFGTYAADGLPDVWQVRYFGIAAARAGKFDDFDDDGAGNLIEFANGTNPSSPASGTQSLRYEGGALVSRGSPAIDYSPTTNALPYRVLFVRRKDSSVDYRPQFSRNLTAWSNATTPLEIVADDGEFELVGLRFPVLIGGLRSSSKFFRLELTTTSE